ncbi:hypothetical protein GQ42DRAFT_164621 [Ramicandelaber brevisporus]|nr:hypothetical protein GQ42DRAFT_164621 [Ramicandelaber brevisporus]
MSAGKELYPLKRIVAALQSAASRRDITAVFLLSASDAVFAYGLNKENEVRYKAAVQQELAELAIQDERKKQILELGMGRSDNDSSNDDEDEEDEDEEDNEDEDGNEDESDDSSSNDDDSDDGTENTSGDQVSQGSNASPSVSASEPTSSAESPGVRSTQHSKSKSLLKTGMAASMEPPPAHSKQGAHQRYYMFAPSLRSIKSDYEAALQYYPSGNLPELEQQYFNSLYELGLTDVEREIAEYVAPQVMNPTNETDVATMVTMVIELLKSTFEYCADGNLVRSVTSATMELESTTMYVRLLYPSPATVAAANLATTTTSTTSSGSGGNVKGGGKHSAGPTSPTSEKRPSANTQGDAIPPPPPGDNALANCRFKLCIFALPETPVSRLILLGKALSEVLSIPLGTSPVSDTP